MTAPNPAVGARPGTFFVDRPDGFVWWVTSEPDPSGVGFRWARFYGLRAHDWDYATQEEAEAADLVNVYAGAPAPLDPGNPEHLRQVREFLGHVGMRNGYPMQAMETVRNDLGHEADRLDRERAEAAQDAADRKRANEYAAGLLDLSTPMRHARADGYYAALQDERARAEAKS